MSKIPERHSLESFQMVIHQFEVSHSENIEMYFAGGQCYKAKETIEQEYITPTEETI